MRARKKRNKEPLSRLCLRVDADFYRATRRSATQNNRLYKSWGLFSAEEKNQHTHTLVISFFFFFLSLFVKRIIWLTLSPLFETKQNVNSVLPVCDATINGARIFHSYNLGTQKNIKKRRRERQKEREHERFLSSTLTVAPCDWARHRKVRNQGGPDPVRE